MYKTHVNSEIDSLSTGVGIFASTGFWYRLVSTKHSVLPMRLPVDVTSSGHACRAMLSSGPSCNGSHGTDVISFSQKARSCRVRYTLG